MLLGYVLVLGGAPGILLGLNKEALRIYEAYIKTERCVLLGFLLDVFGILLALGILDGGILFVRVE